MSFVHTEVTDKVATVTLDRPPVNAMTAAMMRELTEIFTSLPRSREANVAILTATGDRAFCGGVDLNDSARRHSNEPGAESDAVDLVDPGSVVRDFLRSLLDCRLPVICAVNGAAVGLGLAAVASCDLIIASERARFVLPEINAGVLGGARHLQRLVGTHKARRMFFTGEFVPAQEFYRLGAVEAVVPPDEVLPAARELALSMAAKSPIGLRLAKESINRVEDLPLMEGYRVEQDYTGRMTRFADSAEARRATLEKREPTWTWS